MESVMEGLARCLKRQEHLPNKHKALSSNSSTAKKKKKKVKVAWKEALLFWSRPFQNKQLTADTTCRKLSPMQLLTDL
jgi:hypothetical protein